MIRDRGLGTSDLRFEISRVKFMTWDFRIHIESGC